MRIPEGREQRQGDNIETQNAGAIGADFSSSHFGLLDRGRQRFSKIRRKI